MKNSVGRTVFILATAAVAVAWLATGGVAFAKLRLTSKSEDRLKDVDQGLTVQIKDAKVFKISSGFLFGVKLELTNAAENDTTLRDVRMFLQTNNGAQEFSVPMAYDGSLPGIVTEKKGSYEFTEATAVTQLSPLVLTSVKKQPAVRKGEALNTDIPLLWKKGEKLTRWVWGAYAHEPGSRDVLEVQLFDFRRTSGKSLKKPRLHVSTFLNRYVKEGADGARSNPNKPSTP